MTHEIPSRLLRDTARIPVRATETASGFDLFACLDAPVELGQLPQAIPTGIALELPVGFDAQVRPRSGLSRAGVIATFGTVDSDYRGEVMVTLYTTSPEVQHTVQHGDRIAQLVISKLADVRFVATDTLSETARGTGGHGSTGR